MYLLDTNIYISFMERDYPLDIFPTFWELLPAILNEYVIIPRVVSDEIINNKKEFKNFMEENYQKDFLDHRKYMNQWAEVLQYIADSPYYNEKALANPGNWADEKIADGWLIAIAKQENWTLVTDESRIPNRTSHGTKRVKLPDIAEDLGVRCINRIEFFREINLKV